MRFSYLALVCAITALSSCNVGDILNDSSDDDSNQNSEYQKDTDGDGIVDANDADIDGDTYINSLDVFPFDNQEWSDLDRDGIGDNSDTDLDGDNVVNSEDSFPNDNTEWSDLDNDGLGDNSDVDRDGDEVNNKEDVFPNDKAEWSDLDADGLGDNSDTDMDGDEVINTEDAFPKDNTEWSDLDNDGLGDNSDEDKDGDEVNNSEDVFPEENAEWFDTDEDGVGNNVDPDLDGDGVINEADSDMDNDQIFNVFDCAPKDPTFFYNINANLICDKDEEKIASVTVNKLLSGNGGVYRGQAGGLNESKMMGDFNGDGLSDIAINAPYEYLDPSDSSSSRIGKVYIYFGHESLRQDDLNVHVTTMQPSKGVEIVIDLGSSSAWLVEAGDFNGDGLADLIIGDGGSENGSVYIIFGSDEAWESQINLSDIDQYGIEILGQSSKVKIGRVIESIGDINDDGIEDLYIGAIEYGSAYDDYGVGEGFVLFGKTQWNESIVLNQLNGTNGFKINSKNSNSKLGNVASKAGDFNNDGIDDFMLSAKYSHSINYLGGEVFIVFGKKQWSSEFDLNSLNGLTGFSIYSKGERDLLGNSLAGGFDLNNDGISDIVIGALNYQDYQAYDGPGEAYVLFGGYGAWGSIFNLNELDGTNGFTILGSSNKSVGYSLDTAGDFNADGIDDLMISSPAMNSSDNTAEVIILYGKENYPATINPDLITADDAIRWRGLSAGHNIGYRVSGGKDFNGDQVDDIVFTDNGVQVYLVLGFDLNQ